MLTLALDTTAEFGSLALVRDGHVVAETLVHAPEGFSGTLFQQIDALLNRAGLSLADIDVFAAASGPGSFTGVRIGLAAVKGLAEVLGKRAVPVSNLEALSHYSSAPLRATVLDARRGEVFAALYAADGRVIIDDQVIRIPHFLELLGALDFEWVTTDFEPFLPALTGTRFAHLPVCLAPRGLASAIGQIAEARVRSGEPGEPASVEANYVRRSDAESLWREPGL